MNDGRGLSIFRAANSVEGTYIRYYLKNPATADVRIEVVDVLGNVISDLVGSKEAGINRVVWDLRKSLTPEQKTLAAKRDDPRLEPERTVGDLVQPGLYLVKLMINDHTLTTKVQVLPDSNE